MWTAGWVFNQMADWIEYKRGGGGVGGKGFVNIIFQKKT